MTKLNLFQEYKNILSSAFWNQCSTSNRTKNLLQEMGIPDHLICLLRNLYAVQKATVKTRHVTTDWFHTGKGVRQGCILLPLLFSLHAEYIMWNARLDEAQAGIRLLGEISITSNMPMIPPFWHKVKRNKRASWWGWKRGVKKPA